MAATTLQLLGAARNHRPMGQSQQHPPCLPNRHMAMHNRSTKARLRPPWIAVIASMAETAAPVGDAVMMTSGGCRACTTSGTRSRRASPSRHPVCHRPTCKCAEGSHLRGLHAKIMISQSRCRSPMEWCPASGSSSSKRPCSFPRHLASSKQIQRMLSMSATKMAPQKCK